MLSPRSLLTALSTAALVAVGLAAAPPAQAYGYFSVHTFERGSGAPVPYVCYSVEDLGAGGTLASACDNDGDGMVLLETHADECGDCRVHQSLPDLPTGEKTPYLLAPDQDGGWHPYVFHNYLKPYLEVGYRDAHTEVGLPGACMTVHEKEPSGGAFAGCDGDAPNGENGDHDGERNAVIRTARLPHDGDYTVATTNRFLPTGYVKPDPVDLYAPPAEPGDVVTHTFELTGTAGIAVRAVDARRPRKAVKGACYVVRDRTLGGASLGRFCDGSVRSGLAGDEDQAANGVLTLVLLAGGHEYVIKQRSVPDGYRVTKKATVVTAVSGESTVVTVRTSRR